MANNVLVFAERRDGDLKRPALEAISAARGLANTLGGAVHVAAFGVGAGDIADVVGKHGADKLFSVDAEFVSLYQPEAYVASMAAIASANDIGVVLVPATIMGKDLAARLTAKLETGCASDLTEIQVDAAGALSGKRPVYSGKAIAKVSIPTARPAVATLRPNAFAVTEGGKDAEGAAEVVSFESPVSEDQLRVRTVRVEKAAETEQDVAEASVVVSGGRGMKAPEHFSLVRDLAQAVGGAVGASRAVVDDGWIGHGHQVGQTGKVVSPNLYIACGISGQIQHLAGMSSSKVIVAINKDADAPIFKVADYGIVGDVFEVLPALTAALNSN